MKLSLLLLTGLAAFACAVPLADTVEPGTALVVRQWGGNRGGDYGGGGDRDREHDRGHDHDHDRDRDHDHGRDRDHDRDHDRDRDHGHGRDREHDRDRDHDRDHGHGHGGDRDHDHERDRGRGRGHYKRDVLGPRDYAKRDDVADDVHGAVLARDFGSVGDAKGMVKRAVVAAANDTKDEKDDEVAHKVTQLDAGDDEFAPSYRSGRGGWRHRRCYDCPRRFYGWRCDLWRRWCRRRHGDGFDYWGDDDY
ncbi:hypothetical protein JCM10450v2_001034 [Rhodotorula kratochvilovae]